MTPDQIDRVQESFAQVLPIKDAAAEMFYARLFEIAPQVRPIFKGDMSEQGAKLMATLGAVVNGLKSLEAIVPVAEKLAVGHVAYGVKAEHYPFVGEALIDTLKKGLGEALTPDVQASWETAYATLSGVMIAAAYPEVEAAE
ncbi:MAG: globin family protein [Tateyamaria sp.]|uniref:globin family protein n=1 Tax=Tateyamaria sp. TaxID=1929288 RepID=UPI00327F0977